MKILVLGGTQFLGKHIVLAALASGHEVTLFNRGKTNPELFGELEKLVGDRMAGDLSALEGRSWDAVIDPSGYVPRVVKDSAEQINADHYTFISTLSIYSDAAALNQDESAPLATMDDPTIEEITGETYGPLKVLCEQAAEAARPERILHVRSGLIVGPDDHTDRFGYWPIRVARGGDVLAPGNEREPVQFIDVRDQAEWIIRSVEANLYGAFNIVGPRIPMGDVLNTARTLSGSDARIHWLSEPFMQENEVAPWSDMPLYVPSEMAGFHSFNIEKAVANGLTFRSVEETVQATLDFHASRPSDYELKAGLSAEREAELFALWQAHQSN